MSDSHMQVKLALSSVVYMYTSWQRRSTVVYISKIDFLVSLLA